MRLIALVLLVTPSVFAQLAAGNEKGVTMGHIHLLVSNIEVHKKLWVDALGAKTVKAGPPELFEFPGVQVALRKGTPSGGNQGTVIDHLGALLQGMNAFLTFDEDGRVRRRTGIQEVAQPLVAVDLKRRHWSGRVIKA